MSVPCAGVVNLGMELHGEDAPGAVFDGGDRGGGFADQLEALRQLQRFIAMRHPDAHLGGQCLKQRRVVAEAHLGVAVFALYARAHFAAEFVGNELQAVADAEHGHAERKHALVGRRRIGVVNRAWTAGKNDADRVIVLDFRQGGGTGQNGGENILLADAARNQLGILRAEIEDDDGFNRRMFHGLISQNSRPDVKRKFIIYSPRRLARMTFISYNKRSKPAEAG